MNMPVEPLRDPLLRPYLKDVQAWHGYVRFLGFPTLQDHPDTPIWELFVRPLLSERSVSPDSPPETWPKGEPVLAALQEARRLVVLGDPGGGKSTLVNWLAWLLVSGVEERVPDWLRGAIPLPLVLRELDLSGVKTFDGLLAAFLKRPVAEHLRGKEDLLRELLAAGRVLVLADGLDEVAADRREGLRRALWEGFEQYPESYFLATSRVVGYDDYPLDWEEAALGEGRGRLVFRQRLDDMENPGHLVFRKETRQRAVLRHVMPFDDDHIRAFAHNWYRLRSLKQTADSDAADFIAALFRDETTKRLARTPQILTLMALVFRVRAHLPDGRALLYDLITEAYLDSIDQSRKLGPAQDPYPWREKRRWLARVGFEMQVRRTKPLPGGEGKEEVKAPLNSPHPDPLPGGEGEKGRELLASRDEVKDWIAAAMGASGYPADAGYVDQYLDWVARRSGLLLPRGEGQYAFVHLSFQEYAAALYLAEHLTDADWVIAQRDGEPWPDGDPRVTAAALRDWAKDTRWQETLVFCFEGYAHQPRDAKRLAGWLFGEGYSDFLARLQPAKKFSEPPPEAPRAELLARLLADPHSGLGPTEREAAFEAVWQYLDRAERRFDEDIWGGVDPKVLNRVLSAPDWAESFWRRVLARAPAALDLNGADPLDLTRLEPLAGLQVLSLNDTAVGDLSPLAGLAGLQVLSLDGTAVGDLSPLAGLAGLQVLFLNGTAVGDLSPLAGLAGLQVLSLNDTAVGDLSPLIPLADLQLLWIRGVKAPVPEALRREGLQIIGP